MDQLLVGRLKSLLLFSLFLLISGFGYAQEDPQYSQNMYNRLPVNPGYAGSTGAMCATSLLRNQWVGFEGAPVSANLAFDALVETMHGGFGFAVTSDKLGFQKALAAKASYAYRMRVFNNGRLAFGLSGGFFQQSIDLSSKTTVSPGPDPVLDNAASSAIAPDFDFGIYFNTTDYYLGASVTHINEANLDFSSFKFQLHRHYYLMGGYNYALNRVFTLKPGFFVKSDAISTQGDVNLTVLYNNTIWAGVSYRIEDAVIFMAGLNITNELKFGYSYDYTTSSLNLASKGSHEIMLRYCFKINNNKPAYMNKTVRYL